MRGINFANKFGAVTHFSKLTEQLYHGLKDKNVDGWMKLHKELIYCEGAGSWTTPTKRVKVPEEKD
jgi:hypothetical protein